MLAPRPKGPKVVRKAATFTRSKSGITRIKRAGYSTSNGFSVNNEWWAISAQVRKRSKGMCEDHARRGIQVKGTDVHHIIPLSRGGRTVMSNLIHVCDACHQRRHPGNHHLKEHHQKRIR